MPAKYQVWITAAAEGDLAEVFAFIALDSPSNAKKFSEFLMMQTATPEASPLRCPLVPENEVLGTQYRHLIFGDYRIIFKIEQERVFILRIVHGSRLMDDWILDSFGHMDWDKGYDYKSARKRQ